jgi:transposase
MRERKPHLISLPKVSSDDNPVETIFSDIQQMILDNSDDAEARATQCCCSAHLRGRNRCDDRSIQIIYLVAISTNICGQILTSITGCYV